jgi:hypothetical protein
VGSMQPGKEGTVTIALGDIAKERRVSIEAHAALHKHSVQANRASIFVTFPVFYTCNVHDSRSQPIPRTPERHKRGRLHPPRRLRKAVGIMAIERVSRILCAQTKANPRSLRGVHQRPKLRALLGLRIGLGYIGEHEPAAALARLKALGARLLEQSLWLRPIYSLAHFLITTSSRLTSSWRAWS